MPQNPTTDTPKVDAALHVMTATEIADRVLKGIESAAGTAGQQAARVWPEMVRARHAEGIGVLTLLLLVTVAYIGAARFLWRRVIPHLHDHDQDEIVPPICAIFAMFAIPVCILWINCAPSTIPAVFAPEGQYVREIVAQALRK